MSFGITSAGGCALAGSSAIPFTKIHTLHAACISTAGAEFTSTEISEMKIIRATVSTWWRHCTICHAGTRTILWKSCVLSIVIYVWGFPTSQHQAARSASPAVCTRTRTENTPTLQVPRTNFFRRRTGMVETIRHQRRNT